jgi:hypothetical protein
MAGKFTSGPWPVARGPSLVAWTRVCELRVASGELRGRSRLGSIRRETMQTAACPPCDARTTGPRATGHYRSRNSPLATRNSSPGHCARAPRHYRSRNSQLATRNSPTGHWPIPLDRETNILYSHPPMNSALRRYAYFYGYYS